MESVDGLLLLHPTVGPTRRAMWITSTRIRAYQALAQEPKTNATMKNTPVDAARNGERRRQFRIESDISRTSKK
jgi:ATP sulfurylase